MNTTDFIKLLNTTENDFQANLRGYYRTSFFHIYLSGKFDLDTSNLSIEDRGTFLHEYIHYFQNIGNDWGLDCSIIRYQEMLEFKNQSLNTSTIEIPFKINY